MIYPHWKSYFLFSQKELKGIIVLGCILLISLLIGHFLPAKSTRSASMPKSVSLFPFDPNSIDSAKALRLGIPLRQVKSLLHYRQKGGNFKTPADFAKLYGLSPTLLKQLLPYIKIVSLPKTISNRPFYQGYSAKGKEASIWWIDINKADVSTWMDRFHMPAYLAQRIVGYKNYLGYFSQVNQISKVYGISDSLYEIMRTHLRVIPNSNNVMNANAMQFKDWKDLGLFTDQQIWNILKFKKEEGGLSWRKLVERCDLGPSEAMELKRRVTISD